MCEVIITAVVSLISAIVGGLISAYSTEKRVKLEYKEQRKQKWKEKRYEEVSKIVAFLYLLHNFVGHKKKMDDCDHIDSSYNSDKEWKNIVDLKREVYPKIILLFDKDFLSQLEEIYEKISCGESGVGTSILEELENFIGKVRKDYLE